jgi:hypothetical protein
MDLTNLKIGKTTKYVLIHTKTGLPLSIETESNGSDRYACGSHRYTLTDNDSYPLFMVDTQQEAEEAMTFDTPYYNSEYNAPGHGDLSRDDMRVGILEVELKVTPIDATPLLAMDSREICNTYDIDENEVKRLVPEIAPRKRYVAGCLKSSDKRIAELRNRIGQDIYYSCRYDKRKLLAVIDVRPEIKKHCPVATVEIIMSELE